LNPAGDHSADQRDVGDRGEARSPTELSKPLRNNRRSQTERTIIWGKTLKHTRTRRPRKHNQYGECDDKSSDSWSNSLDAFCGCRFGPSSLCDAAGLRLCHTALCSAPGVYVVPVVSGYDVAPPPDVTPPLYDYAPVPTRTSKSVTAPQAPSPTTKWVTPPSNRQAAHQR